MSFVALPFVFPTVPMTDKTKQLCGNMAKRRLTMFPRLERRIALLGIVCLLHTHAFTLVQQRQRSTASPRPSLNRLFSEASDSSQSPADPEDNILFESTVKIDDHGSDLTDRFKYKVNALMGVFDPPSDTDNERAEGNILNAMLNFPVYYSFNVVGRTNNDDTEKSTFVEAVKDIVKKNSGKEDVTCSITPRGTNFTKVTVEAQVESTAIITSIYKELETLEQAVMRF
jgi:putative lipoic acid-binding regulatory protein